MPFQKCNKEKAIKMLNKESNNLLRRMRTYFEHLQVFQKMHGKEKAKEMTKQEMH